MARRLNEDDVALLVMAGIFTSTACLSAGVALSSYSKHAQLQAAPEVTPDGVADMFQTVWQSREDAMMHWFG
jgi:hypothetical protein